MAIHDVARTIASLLGMKINKEPRRADPVIRNDNSSTNLKLSSLEMEGGVESLVLTKAAKQSGEFDENLSLLLKERQRLLAGSIEVIGLEEIRVALGDRWPVFESMVVGLAETELRRSLGPSDTFHRHGDAIFLIHFDDLDQTAAEEKARQVASRIRSTILEKVPEISRTLAVRPFVAFVDSSDIDSPGKRFSDALFARLMKMRTDAVTSLMRRRRSMDREIAVLFSPAWHTQRELTLFNRCLVDTSYYSTLSARLQELGSPEELTSISAEVDYLVFTKSLEMLHQFQQAGRAVQLLIPVDLGTLQDDSTRSEYIRLLDAVPSIYQRYIMLEVCGISPEIASEEVVSAMNVLRSFTKGLVAYLPFDDRRITEIAAGGVWGISTNIAPIDPMDRSLTASLQRFATADGVRGVNTIASGANSIGLATAAFDAGFTFIEGTGIYLPAREPRQAVRLRALSLSPRLGQRRPS